MPDTTTRDASLRQMLCEHRREMQDDLQSRIRDARTRRPNDRHDDLERTEVDAQGDMRFALLEMRAETLARIDQALDRPLPPDLWLDLTRRFVTALRDGGLVADWQQTTMQIAADCRLGEHAMRVRTATGISELRTFYVGALPAIEEKEPNGEFATPQTSEAPVKSAMPIRNSRRWPKRSPSRPPRSRKPPKVSR